MKTQTCKRSDLQFLGWGLIGEPQEGIFVAGPTPLKTIDVSGYNETDYWIGNAYLGADNFGVTPIYQHRVTGEQFPVEAEQYPYLA